MAHPAAETVIYPFTAFNFEVEINVPDLLPKVCNAAFSECDGLEMTMEAKMIREGGNNGVQIRLAGPRTYAQLTLKRGMTDCMDLWDWFDAVLIDPSLRADADIFVIAPQRNADGSRIERARFAIKRCLPVKLKAPALNAKDGMVAIEELQLAYESLTRERP